MTLVIFFSVTKSSRHSRWTWSSQPTWVKAKWDFNRMPWLFHKLSCFPYKGGVSSIDCNCKHLLDCTGRCHFPQVLEMDLIILHSAISAESHMLFFPSSHDSGRVGLEECSSLKYIFNHLYHPSQMWVFISK